MCIHILSTHNIPYILTYTTTQCLYCCNCLPDGKPLRLETRRKYFVKFNYSRCAFGWFLFFWRNNPLWTRTSSFTRFLDHKQRRTTIGRTPLDEWSARRRDLYLTTNNTHNRQTSMPPCGIRTHNFSRQVAADLRLRLSGHRDRHLVGLCCVIVSQCTV